MGCDKPFSGKSVPDDQLHHPLVAADIVIFTLRDKKLSVALIERTLDPLGFALPGGFVRENEDLDQCARRELKEETGLEAEVHKFDVFSAPDRDKRYRVISVAYYALISPDQQLKAGTDAKAVKWWGWDSLPDHFAFADHRIILDRAFEALQDELYESFDSLYALLPKQFTVSEMQELYEQVTTKKEDRSNFRKRVKAQAKKPKGSLELVDEPPQSAGRGHSIKYKRRQDGAPCAEAANVSGNKEPGASQRRRVFRRRASTDNRESEKSPEPKPSKRD